MKESVERVIATILVLICVIKVRFPDVQMPKILSNVESKITFEIHKDKVFFETDTGIGLELIDQYLPAIRWLEKKEKELPPLYSSLELGRSKRDFVCNLARIFYR